MQALLWFIAGDIPSWFLLNSEVWESALFGDVTQSSQYSALPASSHFPGGALEAAPGSHGRVCGLWDCIWDGLFPKLSLGPI